MSSPAEDLVAFDLETSGSRPGQDAIIEIGAARRRAGDVQTFQTFVNPGRPLTPFIRHLTGIRDQDVRAAPTQQAALAAFSAFAGSATLIAHNAPFDLSFLEAGGLHPKGRVVDSLFLAQILLPGLPSHGLAAHAERLGLSFRHHRAEADATVTLRLMEDLLERLQEVDPGWASLAMQVAATKADADLAFFAEALLPLAGQSTWAGPLAPPVPPPPPPWHQVSFADLVRRLGLQSRPSQERFAEAARDLLATGQIGLIEAGTGTGKTIAYLHAALSAAGEGGRAVISTHTRTLQDQLIGKDIPQLEAASSPTGAVVLKGQSNYLCLLRWNQATAEVTAGGDSASRKDHLRLLSWLRVTESGEEEELRGLHVRDEVWQSVNVRGEICTKEACPFYQPCFYYRRRRAADQARLVVVNHALLMADAMLQGALLPETSVLVIDEAHHLEEAAMHAIGVHVEESSINRTLTEITSQQLIHGEHQELLRRLADATRRSWQRLWDQVFTVAGPRRELRLPLAEGPWAALEALAGEAIMPTQELASGLILATRQMADDDPRAAIGQGLAERLRMSVAGLQQVLADELPVRWLETGRNPGQSRLRASPLYAGDALQELLYDRQPAIVMTSATLAIGDDFSHQAGLLGLSGHDRLATVLLPSPFLFRDQALVAGIDDLPDPRTDAFDQASVPVLAQLLPLAPAGSLVLCTSHRQIRVLTDPLQDALSDCGITVLAQGRHGSRSALLERLRKGERVVVMGAQSFWEGIDVVGPALSLLVLTRLPFSPPDTPLRQARAEAIDAEGGSSFQLLSLPEAVLLFKQGFGRLIRSMDDHGAVVILDPRFVRQRYGAAFRKALPDPTIVMADQGTVIAQVRAWLADPVPGP
ncbi:MAG: helicase C-terminal domain-containing protein [Sulfobacillus sp.]